jgi:hypothetical protein
MTLSLFSHPLSPQGPVSLIRVNGARLEDGQLTLHFMAVGESGAIRWPSPGAVRRADELWRHTCFEAFVAPMQGDAYYEFNFAPSRGWAAYRFDSYRSGMAKADVDAPLIEPKELGSMFSLDVTVNLAPLPELVPWESWRLGLSAVIEAGSDGISYWALAHPPGKPDFHHPDCFTLELAPAAFL